jgi:superfamily II DNA or RNA helicase
VEGSDLLQQFHDLFSSLFDEPIGFIGNGICKIERINIASIWTVGRALHINDKDLYVDEDNEFKEEFNESQEEKIIKLLELVKVHIFDESHIITCSTIQSIHKKIDPEHIYGFSGTPFRDDNSDMLINSILGQQIVDVSASELIGKGILAQPNIKFIDVPSIKISSKWWC